MYVDNNLVVSGAVSAAGVVSGQTGYSAGASVLSTNSVDLGSKRDIGEGQDLYGRFEVTIAGAGGTSIECQIIAADDAALTTSVAVLGTTGAIPIASLTLASRFSCAINPKLASKGQRYVGARYVSVGTTTAGSFFADIGAEIQDGQKFYPSGFAVL